MEHIQDAGPQDGGTSLLEHLNDDAALLHRELADALGKAPEEVQNLTLRLLDAAGGRTIYLPSGRKARDALAKEKARALLAQGLGPVDVQRRVAEDDDVGTLSVAAIQELGE